MQKVTHKEAVEAAVILDKYCNQIHHTCDLRVCVFGALECPFEYGCPYYCKREIVELTEKAEKLDIGDKKMENETNLNDVERFNGVDVLKVMEMIKKPNTNFDRITVSPEKLAEWLNEHSDYCREIQNWQCDKCPYGDKDCQIENTWLDWLNEENKE